jgi:hypothetical protein
LELRLVQLIGAELACLVEKKYFLMLAIGIIGVTHMHTHTYRERERTNMHCQEIAWSFYSDLTSADNQKLMFQKNTKRNFYRYNENLANP